MAPSDDQLQFGITALEKFIALKKKVYIHCQNGHGRTSTLLAAYLIYKGKTLDEAIKFIKAKRSSVHFNQIQLTALKDFYNLTHKL
jgi:protein-tyrosine phosphatase